MLVECSGVCICTLLLNNANRKEEGAMDLEQGAGV